MSPWEITLFSEERKSKKSERRSRTHCGKEEWEELLFFGLRCFRQVHRSPSENKVHHCKSFDLSCPSQVNWVHLCNWFVHNWSTTKKTFEQLKHTKTRRPHYIFAFRAHQGWQSRWWTFRWIFVKNVWNAFNIFCGSTKFYPRCHCIWRRTGCQPCIEQQEETLQTLAGSMGWTCGTPWSTTGTTTITTKSMKISTCLLVFEYFQGLTEELNASQHWRTTSDCSSTTKIFLD